MPEIPTCSADTHLSKIILNTWGKTFLTRDLIAFLKDQKTWRFLAIFCFQNTQCLVFHVIKSMHEKYQKYPPAVLPHTPLKNHFKYKGQGMFLIDNFFQG